MNKKERICHYIKDHKSNNKTQQQQLNLYYEKKCKIYICSLCLQKIIDQYKKQTDNSQSSSKRQVKVNCGCKVKIIDIYDFLKIEHQRNKISSINNRDTKAQSELLKNNYNKLCKLKNQEKIIINKKTSKKSLKLNFDPKSKSSSLKISGIQINTSINDEQDRQSSVSAHQQSQSKVVVQEQNEPQDQQFFPPIRSSLFINIEDEQHELLIECFTCHYALRSDQLYPSILKQTSLGQIDTKLCCLGCIANFNFKKKPKMENKIEQTKIQQINFQYKEPPLFIANKSLAQAVNKIHKGKVTLRTSMVPNYENESPQILINSLKPGVQQRQRISSQKWKYRLNDDYYNIQDKNELLKLQQNRTLKHRDIKVVHN